MSGVFRRCAVRLRAVRESSRGVLVVRTLGVVALFLLGAAAWAGAADATTSATSSLPMPDSGSTPEYIGLGIAYMALAELKAIAREALPVLREGVATANRFLASIDRAVDVLATRTQGLEDSIRDLTHAPLMRSVASPVASPPAPPRE